jgi:hypothetical protein
MKKLIFTFFLCLLAAVQSAWGYDFSYTYAGQTLWYEVLSSTDKTAGVAGHPSSISGAVEIPATVTYGGVTYSVTSIGNSAFFGCSGLTEIDVSASNTNYQSIDGILYNKAGDTLICCPMGKKGSVTIPNSVTSIGVRAFEGDSSLTGVTIGNSVKSIGDDAFYGCSGLTSVKIPDSVTSIGASAFYGCRSLVSVNIPNSVTRLGYKSFSYSDLKEIIISSKVTVFDGSFSDCDSLTNVTIQDGVTFISDDAFSGCDNLTNVIIPNTVIGIGWRSFKDCNKLKRIGIPHSVISIGRESFASCISLDSVIIPNSVVSIDEGAFSGCKGLTKIQISDSITTIADSIFCGCTKLNSVNISDGVYSIGRIAFENCTSLAGVNIPKSVITIGYGAFYGCSELAKMVFPNNVTDIGSWAFENCTALTDISIPDFIDEHLLRGVFQGCSGLTSVMIPSVCEILLDSVFYGCSALTKVMVKSVLPPSAEMNCFSVYDTLYVPMQSVSAYEATSPWSEFRVIIGVDFSGVPTIHTDASLYVSGMELRNERNDAVTIYGVTGHLMLNSSNSIIDLESLPHGVYMAVTSHGTLKFVR